MQGWHYGKGLIYLRPIYKANISANKISLPQGQSYAEGKFTYLLAEILALNIGLK